MDDLETLVQVRSERPKNVCRALGELQQRAWTIDDYHGLNVALSQQRTRVDVTACPGCDAGLWTRCVSRINMAPPTVIDAKRVGPGYLVRPVAHVMSSVETRTFGLWPDTDGPTPTAFIACVRMLEQYE